MKLKAFKNGLLTGLFLQLALGPVFFFIVNLTLQRSLFDGLAGALAITIVDYVYITLSIFGVDVLLKNKKTKKVFGVISSIVLIIFGGVIIKNLIDSGVGSVASINSISLFSSFVTVFLLGISSPLTIIFFTSLFTAKAIEYNYKNKELILFGAGTGLATFLFMSVSAVLISLLKGVIPVLLIQSLNIVVGCLLIGYGGVRLVKVLKT